MKKIFNRVYILILILPLLGAVSYKDIHSGSCAGLPNFSKIVTTNNEVTLSTSSINQIVTATQTTVLGEIKNTSKTIVSAVTVTAVLKDSSGNIIDTKTATANGLSRRIKNLPDTIDSSVILPGGSGYFSMTEPTSTQKAIATVETTVTSDTRKTLKLNGNLTATITKEKRSDNNLNVRGNVTNDAATNIPTWNNKIVIVIKNKSGLIVFIGVQNLGDTININNIQRTFAILPGDQRDFIFQTNVNFDTVGSIKKIINWEEEAPTLPAAPGNLKASVVSPTDISLTFTDNSTDEDGFKIFKKTSSGTFKMIKKVNLSPDDNGTVTESDIGVFKPGKKYTYKVTAFNEMGNSAYSNVVQIKVSAPVAPLNLTAAAIKSPRGIQLTWDNPANNNETKFIITRNDGKIVEVENVTTYTDTDVTFGTAYTYTVSAANGIGNSSDVTTSPITLNITDFLPSAPENLEAAVVKATDGTGQIDLSWKDKSNDETGFSIIRSIVGDATSSVEIPVDANTTKYTDQDLISGKTYKYEISAFNDIGTSTSDTANKTITFDKPVKPTTLTVTSVSPTQNHLAWSDTDIDNATGFKVERKRTADTSFTVIANIAGSNIEGYDDTLVTPNTTYIYRVKAYNELGDSDPSNEAALP